MKGCQLNIFVKIFVGKINTACTYTYYNSSQHCVCLGLRVVPSKQMWLALPIWYGNMDDTSPLRSLKKM